MKKGHLSQQASSVMMVRPAAFGFNAETAPSNFFQQKGEGVETGNIHEAALREFDAVTEVLRDAGIGVHVFQSSDVRTPDAIFPNNWFSTHHDGTIVLYPMSAPNRRLERSSGLLSYLQEHFQVKALLDLSSWEEKGKYLEGTGSIVFDHGDRKAYAVLSPRTSKDVFIKLSEELMYDYCWFHCEDEGGRPVYHTNVAMHIGTGYVLCCMEGMHVRDECLQLMECFTQAGKEVLPLSMQQMHHFCGNMLQLKNKAGTLYTVCSNTALRQLSDAQLERLKLYTNLLPVDIPVIEKTGGGGVRCMLAEIFLTDKNHG